MSSDGAQWVKMSFRDFLPTPRMDFGKAPLFVTKFN